MDENRVGIFALSFSFTCCGCGIRVNAEFVPDRFGDWFRLDYNEQNTFIVPVVCDACGTENNVNFCQ